MSDTKPAIHANVYHNTSGGATPNPFMPNPDAIDEAFIAEANRVLSTAVELIRVLIGAHQGAVAIIVQRDWQAVHKFFSLSEKYAAGADYRTPAQGIGIHAWMLRLSWRSLNGRRVTRTTSRSPTICPGSLKNGSSRFLVAWA